MFARADATRRRIASQQPNPEGGGNGIVGWIHVYPFQLIRGLDGGKAGGAGPPDGYTPAEIVSATWLTRVDRTSLLDSRERASHNTIGV
ncbi:hypothetical protein GCM10027294_20160 [Marinactinospora endophytica]